METVERDLLALIQQLELLLAFTLDIHIRAGDISSACRLPSLTGCEVAYLAMDGLPCADIGVTEDRLLTMGNLSFKPLYTPVHTDTHHCCLMNRGDTPRVVTGDAVVIDDCGRTDFQNGNAKALYRSVCEKIFTLREDTLIYPSHDDQHRHVSTVLQERERNPRLGDAKPLEEFAAIITNLNLPYPRMIDGAVPANRLCGDCPVHAPEALRRIGDKFFQGVPA